MKLPRFLNWFGRDVKSLSSLADAPFGYAWPQSKSGYVVTATTAPEVSTVMACVRAIAEGCSQVPIYAHAVDDRGVLGPKVSSPVLDVFRRPNEWQSGFEFRETLLVHLALVGNAFVYVSRRGDGSILELIPIEPGKVFVTRERDMSLTYRVTFEDGTSPVLRPDEMWHIRGPSWNTWMGLDAVKLARESIGLAKATEEAHAAMHSNGAQISGLLSVAEKMGLEKYKEMAAWLDRHGSQGDRRGKPIVLDMGAKWQPFGLSGVDAQHVETRRHQVLEICRHFRVNPMMVGASETPTYASAEQMFTAHVVHTLQPWAERIEQSALRALLDGQGVELRHDFNGMMRGDARSRSEYNAKALGSGGSPAWMTPNEVRAQEGLDPIAGGDDLPRPANTIAAAQPETQDEPA